MKLASSLLLFVVLFVTSSPVAAEPLPPPTKEYGAVADLVKDLPSHRGEVVKLLPEKLGAKRATFYGCAFADKKKWEALTLTDHKGTSITAYAANERRVNPEQWKGNQCGPKCAPLQYALLKAPAAGAKCKVSQFELLDY
jgi:hypothetical protein